jgi:stage II sporulation SpoM-like protein
MKTRSFWQFYAAPLAVMVLAYVLPLATATTAVRAGDPQAMRMRQEVLRRVGAAGPVVAAARLIEGGRTVRAGFIVFLWNFVMGAVVMSTLVGGVFFVFPPMVAMGRGLMLGLLYDPATFEGARGVVAAVTGALELPAYMIAGALGMRLGLAWLLPPRRDRLLEVWDQAKSSIPAIALMLLVAAAWEVGGIVLVGARP